ncbi:MAG: fructose-bisphosphate aldolase [Deltaproteobacteria bacterium]|nr:fructose-bisphosphate aldolase [Deltaproteobacteria bacterium]
MVKTTTERSLRFFQRLAYSPGEIARVRQFVRPTGTTLILPYDQFIEHDCRHLEAESDAGNPDTILELAVEGKYNAVAIHYGIAKRYWSRFSGKVPLILKISGKTGFPPQDRPLSVYTACVEDAVKLGAVAVGYTMYYGSPRETEDLPQLTEVRRECERFGLPLIVWAYPRGEAVDKKGGRDTSYALESAARMAMEMGAAIIKSNLPAAAPAGFTENKEVPKYYRDVEAHLMSMEPRAAMLERAKRVVKAAQGVPILFSGGSEKGDGDLLEKAKICVEGGCFGFIFGRNMWKRPKAKALEITEKLCQLLDE